MEAPSLIPVPTQAITSFFSWNSKTFQESCWYLLYNFSSPLLSWTPLQSGFYPNTPAKDLSVDQWLDAQSSICSCCGWSHPSPVKPIFHLSLLRIQSEWHLYHLGAFRNAEFQVPPQIYWIGDCILTKIPKWFVCMLKFEKHCFMIYYIILYIVIYSLLSSYCSFSASPPSTLQPLQILEPSRNLRSLGDLIQLHGLKYHLITVCMPVSSPFISSELQTLISNCLLHISWLSNGYLKFSMSPTEDLTFSLKPALPAFLSSQ